MYQYDCDIIDMFIGKKSVLCRETRRIRQSYAKWEL